MKKHWLLILPLTLFIVLFLFILLPFVERPVFENALVPEITTTNQDLDSQKEDLSKKTASPSAFIRIEEKIAGEKFVPKDTVVITNKGNDLLVLINKSIRLPASYVPPDLVSLSVSSVSGGLLRAEAAGALKEMFNSATAQGVNLHVNSPYRSYSHQISVFNGWVASSGLANAEAFSARPGHSQHQLGTAVDISTPGISPFSEGFASSKAGVWLANNGPKFGFVLSYPKGKEALTGYSYEPWHWRYIGKTNAQKMISSGLILEAYLQKFGVW